MANLSSKRFGPGSMKDVPILLIQYDTGVQDNKNGSKTYFPHALVHPDTDRGKGQTDMFLKSTPSGKQTKDGKNLRNHGIAVYQSQMDAIVAAAGDNTAPYLNAQGEQIGTVYSVVVDLQTASTDSRKPKEERSPANRYLGPDFRAAEKDGTAREWVRPSDLAVDDKTISRAFAQQAEAKAAEREAAAPEAEAAAPEATAEAAPKDAKRSEAAKKAAATRRANKAKAAEAVEATEASADEPSFG